MKIIHIQHPFIPNKGYQENYLPREQAKLGHDVTIVSTNILPEKFRNQSNPSQFNTGRYDENGVEVRRLRSHSLHGAATYSLGIEKVLSQEDPDIIHSHRLISVHTLQSIIGQKFTGGKLFFDAHIDNDNFHLNTRGKAIGFELFKKTIAPFAERQATRVLPVNPYCEQFLINNLGISDQKIELLPLGVDTGQFYSSESERMEIRAELGYSAEDIVYIFAGNIMPEKDLENLITAFSKLDLDNKELLILGEGEEQYMSRLRRTVDHNSINEQVTFHDFVPHSDLSKYYNAADVGVWPGKLGITIIEAISCGLPVILPSSSATDFLLENNGLTYSRGNVKELSGSMEQYGVSEHHREQSKESAIQLVNDKLAWSEVAKQSIEIYMKE